MTATIEREIGELRSDVRHVGESQDAANRKLDELLSLFSEHLRQDDLRFAKIDGQFTINEAEKRGEGRFARVVEHAIAVIVAIAGAWGMGKMPGMH